MPATSGGTACPSDCDLENLPAMADAAANAAKRQLVSRRRDVELVFSQPTAVDSVVAAIVSVVTPPEQIECIQQLNPKKFLVSFKAADSAEYFHRVLAPSLHGLGSAPVSKWLGAERRKIRVAFLPHAVPNSELADVLKPYGRVLDISDEFYADTPVRIKTGTRLAEMEMTSPVPNMITVCGFTVPVTYKGVVLQCRRCMLTGHLKADCNTPFCDRCKSFGHCADRCNAPCLKCKAPDHHWKNCSVRSYAFAAASNVMFAAPSVSPAAELNIEASVPVPCGSGSGNPKSQENNLPNAEVSISDDTLDAFDSATEHNSESDSTTDHTEDACNEKGEADDKPNTRGENARACAEELTCGGPWEGGRLRRKKRKNVSITPDKLPDAKKNNRT